MVMGVGCVFDIAIWIFWVTRICGLQTTARTKISVLMRAFLPVWWVGIVTMDKCSVC